MGKLLRTIWNGPFHIGPLTRPVSVGDVLLKILEVSWRVLLLAVAAFIAFMAIIFLNDRRTALKHEEMRKAATISVMIDTKGCSEAYPIKVVVSNVSGRPIGVVGYDVKIVDPAIGVDIAPAHFRYLRTNAGLAAGQGWQVCMTPFRSPIGDLTDFQELRSDMTMTGEVAYVEEAA